MDFGFLSDLSNVVIAAPVKAVKEKAEKVAKEKVSKLPQGMTLRVYANGKVYPSAELVTAMSLEYVAKDSEAVSNGLDIFPANKIAGLENFNCILISATSKKSPKVDLFGQCRYDDATGAPLNSVLTQGGTSFGPELVDMIQTVYGIVLEKGTFIDMEVRFDVNPKFDSPVVFIPKTIDRGPKKGTPDYARRENILVYALVPIIVEQPEIAVEEIEELPPVTDLEAQNLTEAEQAVAVIQVAEQEIPVNPLLVPEKPVFVLPNLGNAEADAEGPVKFSM